MKSRVWMLAAVCLLVAAAGWLFWPHWPSKTAAPHSGTGTGSALAAKHAAAPGTNGGASASVTKFPTLNTNKFAYRLSNTTNTLRQLQAKPHAILLANTLIDTDLPLDLKIPPHLRSDGDPGAYIVEARRPIDPPFRTALAAAHAGIVSYIPNNAYLVNVDAGGAAQLAGNSEVQAVLPYEPYFKLQSSLLGLAVNQQPLPPGTALTLGLFGGDPTALAEIQQLGVPIIGHDQSPFGPVVRVLAPADWTILAQSPAVQFLEPAFPRRLANDLSRVTLGISPDTTSGITNDYAVNGYILSGNNVLVAVNDSGIDIDHPDFGIGGTAQAPDTAPPSRVLGLTPLDLVDTNGHGTHVAGSIAGNGSMSLNPVNVGTYAEGSVPNADFRGKAPSAWLFSVNEANYSDYQLQTNAALQGALISNNSWDYGNGDQDYDLAAASYDFATRDAVPGQTGSQPVLFVFAAGNDGGGADDGTGGSGDTIVSPGTAKNVITVGALEQLRDITNIVTTIIPGIGTNAPTTNQVAYWYEKTDSSDQVAGYSSRGNVGIGTEGNNGRFKPDVVSPGTFVVSTSSQFNDQWDTNAYYNPTNEEASVYTDQVVNSNALVYYNVQVPPNAVAVNISIHSNNLSPHPFPNLVIYCQQSGYPDPVNDFAAIDIISYNNMVAIPPGAKNCTIANLQGNGFNFAVGVTNDLTVNYDLTVDILVTNDVGNLNAVLEGMNNSLGGYYRYESGTSMAAAGVSGVLALIQDYFTNQLNRIPSPALMKALLINGARTVGDYGIAFTNGINFQGWGLENIQNSVPEEGLFDQTNGTTTGSTFFVEQSPNQALATGDRHTFLVTVNTNTTAQDLFLQATLVWTDPPGDPSAAIKLVNNLVLVVTNLDPGDPNFGAVYIGNDIQPSIGYNLPWNTNGPPNYDTINNVENVILPPALGGKYSVTVVGRSVNVNAVSAQVNNSLNQYAPNIVQDFALVIAVGEGEVTNAFTVTDGGIASNPTGGQDVTQVMSTNAPLSDQIVGASSPLLGTNSMSLGTNTQWGSSGVLTIGQTNQWHFYVVTNNGAAADYTNAAFLTFGVSTLSIPRMGVYEDSISNATTAEANLDLFVSQDPSLLDLNPAVISNCLAGANNCRAALANAGTQFAFYTNSKPGQIYYVGVQSQDQMAGEYSFMPIFTDVPFSSLDQNGNQIVNGLLLPMPIPSGNNAHPGLTNVFALAVIPMVVEKVTVTNLDEHQNFGDLFGALEFDNRKVVLNNHDGFGNTIGNRPIVYDDSPNKPLGTTNTDGPGSLVDFQAQSALGPWILSVLDNAAGGATGQVSRLTLVIQPHRNLKQPGVYITLPPGGWFYDWVDVPAGYTNLTIYGTNVTAGLPAGTQPVQMYELLGNDPTLTDYDQEATLTNGLPPGNSISVGPPLPLGRYFVGLYNPDVTVSQTIFLSVTLGIGTSVNDLFNYTSGASQVLLDDAVTPAPAPTDGATPNPLTSGSTIIVPAGVTNLVSTLNVGIVVDSPRISDYAFTLVSPTGQRVLLMQNRGGANTNGAGLTFVYTNVINSTATGGAAAQTNYLAVYPNPSGTTVPITWNFFTVPDQMTIYSTTNPADFITNSVFCLYNTGLTNNPPAGGGGAENTIPVTTNLYVPALVTNITIIMNQFGNPDAANGDAWIYTAGAPSTNYEYLVFTDDTNLASVPIKFAEPPFSIPGLSTNFALSDLDRATNGNYFGPTNINDQFNGGWLVPTNVVLYSIIPTNGQFLTVTNVVRLTNNLVSVVTDPSTALSGDAGGSNYLALGKGTITRSIPTIPGQLYNVTFWYRGPGIAGWWRGEGNANDSSDPENDNNNGQLIGRFNFPAGEVGQAFEFEDLGNTYEFAGTNAYVQVPASPSLNVGADGGFTVEGWINPTNLSRPEPLVEWLARVPTNAATADTNLAIVQGPVLDPATGNYYYLLASTNWATSETWAGEMNGNLVAPQTANEEQWVYDTFTAYGTLNRDLWTGLHYISGIFRGDPNQTYTNWAPGEPAGACGDAVFVAIMGPTNSYPGLWQLLDNLGQQSCGNTTTNPVYGVVEVADIPTNGVQFWISGTNGTGPTNYLQGCLFANIVDTNYISHTIYSAPGLLTSNVYQHVALTFNTNSGVAALYLNGTNVATSNLYAGGVSFVPKTDGDLLLGHDMTRYTNNFFGGEMDEMSVYGRALSLAEISAIYNASALTTNRLTGKFNPAVTPAVGLAEALVTFGSSSNLIFGVNNQWEVNSFTFTASSNSMPLTISGLEPGILLDDFSVASAPETNLYYFPEQPLSTLNGDTAAGNWTLQVWDSRAGEFVTNVAQLVSWEMSFVLVSNAVISATLPPQTPVTSTVEPGQTVFYAVPVPTWALSATNVLVSSSQPVDLLYYSPANPPTTAVAPTATLLTAVTSGSGAPISLTPAPFGTYYLGVRNNGAHAASVVLEVDFDITGLANGTPDPGVLSRINRAVRYYSYDVSSNAYEATFQLLQLSGNADLVISKGGPLPDLNGGAYGSFNNGTADQDIYVLTNSAPVPLSAGRWYLGVLNRTGTPVEYSVLAKELDVTNLTLPTGLMPAIINLTNGVPVTWTAGPGAALTNFFHFYATNSVVNGTNVLLDGLRFELYNLTGNGDLTVQTNGLPLAPPFYQSSQNPGTSPELIFVFTNNVQTNLAGDWYLGVPNRETNTITYTIVAEILTNLYFPAFPGAQGAGGGAAGGRFGDVYHVISTNDSGLGSLREALATASANRTVVFDVSGTIDLASPLVITNSYLTIAGETAPGGGITLAGNMTTITNSHDVIARDVRFRSGAAYDSFQFANASNVIADHISAEWAADNLVSVLNSSNVTVQWSVLANSLYNTNTLATNRPTGALLRQGSGSVSFHHNLFADNYTGSPRLGDNLTLDFVNNVIYNWGLFSGLSDGTIDQADFSPNGCTNQLNYVCNYLIAGPDTADFGTNYAITNIAFFGGPTNSKFATWIFQTNNFIDSDLNGVLNGSDTGWAMFTNDYTPFSHPFSTLPVSVNEAYQGYEMVLDFAGVDLALRDPADTNIITGVRRQTGRLIGLAPMLPGLNNLLPYQDTDQDGLPDFWEYTFTPTNVFVPSNNHLNGDGYTDLEEYNNWLAGPHAVTITNTSVGVDLYQLCGESGHLAFYVTNGVHGVVSLTNVLGSVTNLSTIWSNTIAVFTPTNNPGSATNYYGYASFDFYVTNLDTAAYFGPVTVSVIVSAVPITINSNMPPVITPLISGVGSDPTNYGGSDYYSIVIPANAAGALFEIDNPTGPIALVVGNGPSLPSLSSFAYYTNQPAAPANLQIAVLTNTMPVPLTPGTWYMAAVNESGSNVVYTAKITVLGSFLPPEFIYPANGTVITTIETTPLTITCVGMDLDTPPLPLSFGLVSGPPNLTVSSAGVLDWTPNAAQIPSTNAVKVSVSNGAFSVTNAFTIIVEDSNSPPVLPFIPNQVVTPPGSLAVIATATDANVPPTPLFYTLTSTVTGANQPVVDANGIITWTPTPAQSDASYLLTIVVTNWDPWAINAQSLSATESFYVSVLPGLPPGGGPQTNNVPPNSISWFVVRVPDHVDMATNWLLFASSPVNLWYSTNLPPSITNGADFELLANSTGGTNVISLTSVPPLVPRSTYFLGVQNLGGSTVNEALQVTFHYQSPDITDFNIVHTNFIGTNGFLIYWQAPANEQFHLQWSPNLGPRNWANFNGVISFLSLTSGTTGQFEYFDDGSQTGGFAATRYYRLLWLDSPTNTPPFFAQAPSLFYFDSPLVPFVYTNLARDWDIPPQTLYYSVSNSLTGGTPATIDSGGVITWTPTLAQEGLTNVITTTVTDSGIPTGTAVNSFSVIVTTNLVAPLFSTITVGTNGVTFLWTAPASDTFQIRWTTNLVSPNWQFFPTTITSLTTNFTFVDTNTPLVSMKFYQLMLLP